MVVKERGGGGEQHATLTWSSVSRYILYEPPLEAGLSKHGSRAAAKVRRAGRRAERHSSSLGPRSHICQGSSSRKARSERHLVLQGASASKVRSRRSWQPTTPLLTSAFATLHAQVLEAPLSRVPPMEVLPPKQSRPPQWRSFSACHTAQSDRNCPPRVQGWHSSSMVSSQPPRRMLLALARGSEGLGRGCALTQRIFPHGSRSGLTYYSSSL